MRLRDPGRRAAGDDLNRDEAEEQAAQERDRRRHRQAVEETEHDDEERESAVAQDGDDLGNGQAVAWLVGKPGQDLGRTGFAGQEHRRARGTLARTL